MAPCPEPASELTPALISPGVPVLSSQPTQSMEPAHRHNIAINRDIASFPQQKVLAAELTDQIGPTATKHFGPA